MKFSEIKPYVRFARVLTLNKMSVFSTYVAYDARLFYVLNGEGIIAVGGRQIKMKKGSAIIINSGVEYRVKEPKELVTYVAFNFDFTYDNCHIKAPVFPAFKDEYDPKKLVSSKKFTDDTGKQLNGYFYIEDAKRIEKKALSIVAEYKQMFFEYELKNSCLMADILIDILRAGYVAPSEEELPRAIIEYVNKNYFLPVTNQSVGEVFGFHPNYLSALMKRVSGMSLHQYIIHVRLLRAAELLESGTYSISEVAEKTGFCDIYYFSRCFKKKMNQTPLEYAKKFRSK